MAIKDQFLVRHCKLKEIPDPSVSSRHQVYLNGCHVIKEYAFLERNLDAFYEDTKNIVGIEKKIESGVVTRKRTRSRADLTFFYELVPAGLDVLPTDFPKAIPVLIDVVQNLHKMGWVHLDIRWANVIFEPINEKYFLIDCEFATKIGENLPCKTLKCLEGLKSIPENSCCEIDWYSLGKMISMIRPLGEFQKYAEAFISFDIKKIDLVLQQ